MIAATKSMPFAKGFPCSSLFTKRKPATATPPSTAAPAAASVTAVATGQGRFNGVKGNLGGSNLRRYLRDWPWAVRGACSPVTLALVRPEGALLGPKEVVMIPPRALGASIASCLHAPNQLSKPTNSTRCRPAKKNEHQHIPILSSDAQQVKDDRQYQFSILLCSKDTRSVDQQLPGQYDVIRYRWQCGKLVTQCMVSCNSACKESGLALDLFMAATLSDDA